MEMPEAEMTSAVEATPDERTSQRLGSRSGYHKRSLVTRVGKPGLRLRRVRKGRFSTTLFGRYPCASR